MEDFLQSLMSIEEELNTEDNSEESVSLIQSLVLKRKAKKLLIIDPSFILKRFDYTKEGGISFIKSGLSIDIKYEDIEGNEFSRTLGTKPATRALDALLMQLNYKDYDTVILAYDCPPYKRTELSTEYKQDRAGKVYDDPEEIFFNKYLIDKIIFPSLNFYKLQIQGCEFDDTVSWILENFDYETADVMSNDSDLYSHFSNPSFCDKIALVFPEKGFMRHIDKKVFTEIEGTTNVLIPNYWKFYQILSGGHNNIPKFRPGMAQKGALNILNDMVSKNLEINRDGIIAYMKTTSKGISEDEIVRLDIGDKMQTFPLQSLDYKIQETVKDIYYREPVASLLKLNLKNSYETALQLISSLLNIPISNASAKLSRDKFELINCME